MPLVPFDTLPDTARTWVFAADANLSKSQSGQLLNAVDEFLDGWKAHGEPLTVGRDWKYNRFLTVAVDQSTAGASGCSIDGLFRILKSIEARIGSSLVGGGRVFFRNSEGVIQSASREEFAKLGRQKEVSPSTVIFDPSVVSLGEWRSQFESDVAHSWHGALLKERSGQPA